MANISLSFPDQTYSTSNKPSADTLKTDIAAIEAGYNAHDSATEAHSATGAVVGTTNSQTLTNKTLTSPTINTPTIVSATLNTAVSGTAVLDEDDMASNSATKVATQQSIKAYVDTHIADTTTHGVTGAIVGISDAQTLTNKRVDPRTNTVASDATPDINVDTTDIFTITALAAAITSMTSGLTGTPVNGQKLIIRIKDDGTARAITWGTSFASRGATLPTTTVLGKYLYVGLIYNSTASVWDCVATSQEL